MPDSLPEDREKKTATKEGRKRQLESGSQMDEDCHSGSSHCCETSASAEGGRVFVRCVIRFIYMSH